MREKKQAAKKQATGFQLEDEPEETKSPAAPIVPRKETSADDLINKHTDYVGERDDRTLVGSDWGDIKKMRTNGLPDIRIAKSYGVAPDYLARFIGTMEKLQPGEALPPF